MNRNLLLSIAVIVAMIAAAMYTSGGWIYLATSLMAITIMAALRKFRGIKVTRWAKANPRKTQVFITVLQLVIISLGLLIGYNLKELGYQLSSSATIVFGTILCYGFFAVRFLPKRKLIALPATLNKDRMAYLGIILSAFVLMVITGNRIEDRFPGSTISRSLKSIDHAMFARYLPPVDATGDQQEVVSMNENASMFSFASLPVMEGKSASTSIDPRNGIEEKIKAGKKAHKLEKKKERLIKHLFKSRTAFSTGATILTVLLVILLVMTTCAGICLIALGTSAGAVILGVLLTAASIFGFIKIFNKKKRVKTG